MSLLFKESLDYIGRRGMLVYNIKESKTCLVWNICVVTTSILAQEYGHSWAKMEVVTYSTPDRFCFP